MHEAFIMFTSLLEKSDSRIDRTNEMVCKLADATANVMNSNLVVIKEYSIQLEKMQKSRDELLHINSILADAATAPKTIIENHKL